MEVVRKVMEYAERSNTKRITNGDVLNYDERLTLNVFEKTLEEGMKVQEQEILEEEAKTLRKPKEEKRQAEELEAMRKEDELAAQKEKEKDKGKGTLIDTHSPPRLILGE
ncbi:hypothetical protein P8452_77834 [Trifolium repens]|nr:hypothetical protein P8452_77834 [Trifolium repens]